MDFYQTSQTQHVQNWTYLPHPQASHTHNILHLSWWQLLSVTSAESSEVTSDFVFNISHSIQFKNTPQPQGLWTIISGWNDLMRISINDYLISFKSPLQWNLIWEPCLILQLVSFAQSCTSFSPYLKWHFSYSSYYIYHT